MCNIPYCASWTARRAVVDVEAASLSVLATHAVEDGALVCAAIEVCYASLTLHDRGGRLNRLKRLQAGVNCRCRYDDQEDGVHGRCKAIYIFFYVYILCRVFTAIGPNKNSKKTEDKRRRKCFPFYKLRQIMHSRPRFCDVAQRCVEDYKRYATYL